MNWIGSIVHPRGDLLYRLCRPAAGSLRLGSGATNIATEGGHSPWRSCHAPSGSRYMSAYTKRHSFWRLVHRPCLAALDDLLSPVIHQGLHHPRSRQYSSITDDQIQVPSAVTVDISENKKVITLTESTGHSDSFNATWLRQNCRCPLCVQSDSGQRIIEPSQLAPEYTIKSVDIKDQCLMMTWNEESHEGRVPLTYLADNSYSRQTRNSKALDQVPPTAHGVMPKVPYSEIVQSDRGLWQWTKHLNEEGMCVVQGVPNEISVKDVVGKIWTLMPTIYGETFVVEASPKPINIAYSSVYLGLHMDLVYYESPPGYQFLLCKRFDDCCVGGENILVDSWYVAEQMRRQYPEEFATLVRVPATFQKIHSDRERPVHMTYRRPHIIVDDESGQITNVNWAPAFEGPLRVDEEDVDAYYAAYHKFAKLLEDSDKVEHRLREGELLSFNNRRILHSRNSYELNGGRRYLEGCYLNIDETKSKTQVLMNKFEPGKMVKNVFNQNKP